MKVLTGLEAAQMLCRLARKPGIYFAFLVPETVRGWEEIPKAAPWLRNHHQCLADGAGVVLCRSVRERDALYTKTVGDDGPTKANPYKGPWRVYACTIEADGTTGEENT